MKKVILFVLYCAVIIVVLDFAFDVFTRYYVKSHPLPGDYASADYIIKRSTEDIIILGSSIALNSLNPKIMEDSLGMTCFNGSANGQTLPYYESMIECVMQRYVPQMIILGLTPWEMEGSGTGGRYNFLVPYYNQGYHMIDSCLEAKDKYEHYLLKSSFYTYNTIWWRILLYHFIIPDEPGEKGFVAKGIPLVYPDMHHKEVGAISEERKAELNNIISRCEEVGTKLVIYFPPVYYDYHIYTPTVEYVKQVSLDHNIPCFVDFQSPEYLNNKEWFYDNNHLNKVGAELYSREVASRIKQILGLQDFGSVTNRVGKPSRSGKYLLFLHL